MFERPFTYILNTDNLTAGTDVQNAIINLDSDAPFALRSVAIDTDETDVNTGEAGNCRAVTTYRLYGPTSQYLNDNPQTMGRLLSPQVIYPAGGQIRFDLFGVLKPANYNDAAHLLPPNFKGQIVCQGAKLFESMAPQESPYPYSKRWYIHRLDIPITWTGRIAPGFADPNPPRSFVVEVTDYDFELHRVYTPITAVGRFKYVLYDSAQNQLSNAPVLDAFTLTYGSYQRSPICTPVPHLVYRVGSQIKIDIYSLLTPAGVGDPVYSRAPQTISLYLQGAQRIPGN